MPIGYTTVSATNLCDATGSVIANATISFRPVDNKGNSISFRAGGSSQGQATSHPVTATVTNGSFSIVLADTTLTTPVNVGYSVTVTDNVSGDLLLSNGYQCVQPSGSTWSFDTYQPNFAAQVTVQTGPQGIQGIPGTNGTNGTNGANGIASLPQLAAVRVAGPVTNLFDSSVADVGYYRNDSNALAGGGTYPGFVTGKIPANTGGNMVLNKPLVFGAGGDANFYDANGAFLRGWYGSSQTLAGTPIAIPADVAFVDFSISSSSTAADIASLMVVNGSTVPTTYLPFAPANAVAIESDIATVSAAVTATNARVDRNFNSIRALANFRAAKNLIGPQIMTTGGYLNADGTINSAGAPYQYSANIPVMGGESYTIGWPSIPAIPVQPAYAISNYGGVLALVRDINGAVIQTYWPNGAAVPGPATIVFPGAGIPNGYNFVMPNAAASIQFSGANVTHTSGAEWGLKGTTDFWTPDPTDDGQGNCSCIFIHGTALPSDLLPYGKSASDYQSRYYGVPLGIIGDSISSLFGVGYQQPLWEAGFRKQVQDARPGRNMTQVFEGFQTVTPGAAPGTYDAGVAVGAQSGCAQGGYLQSGQTSGGVNWGGMALGQTLAQVYGPCKILVLEIGTNDVANTIGTLGDATNAGTVYGNIRWIYETLQAANPTMLILPVTPMARYDGTGFTATSTLAQSAAVAAAMVAYFKSVNNPVLDMFHESGVNALTVSQRTQDGIHPALGSAGMTGYYGGAIKGFIEAHY